MALHAFLAATLIGPTRQDRRQLAHSASLGSFTVCCERVSNYGYNLEFVGRVKRQTTTTIVFLMQNLLLAWAGLLVALVMFAVRGPGHGGALTLAYFLGLSLIHVPGVLPFLNPGSGLDDFDETLLGFELTILGMAAFVAGAILVSLVDQRHVRVQGAPHWRAQVFESLGRRALGLGVVAYFVIVPLSARVPSLTSVVSSLATLLIIGIWLALYGAAAAADRRRTLVILALLPLLPLATLVTGGFLGYGVYWVLSVIAFLFVITSRRAWFYWGTPVAMFLGLSLFVTYMGQRNGIREVVWYEQSSLLDRFDRVTAIITDFELLDLAAPDQVTALDGRLNQNALVGAGVQYHEAGAKSFAYGGTIPPWALIPRAVWPDKPEIGGGGDVVAEFTGIDFARGTSVGAGQVFEFYVNFGIPGVLAGFFGLGYLLMWLDRRIMRSLAANDLRGFLLRAMPGLMLLQPGGNLLEILVGSIAGFIGAHLVTSLRFFDVSLPTGSGQRAF